MNKYFFLLIFIMIASCTTSKNVYWCGDHPCINNKEKEAYFNKTMIVEIREVNIDKFKKKTKNEKVLEQASKEEKLRLKMEKELTKQAKLDEKIRIKREKELAKQAKLDEKIRIKREKELAKQAKIDEKKRIKAEKELAKEIELEEKIQSKKIIKEKKVTQKENVEIKKVAEMDVSDKNIKINLNKFSEIVEKVTNRNNLRPFPDINDIPN